MDNQHRKITGYRELDQGQIDLMNEVKSAGAALEGLISRVDAYLDVMWIRSQNEDAANRAQHIHDTGTEGPDTPIQRAFMDAEPHRWLALARTDLQVGLMKLTRAAAQPGFF